MWHKGRKVNKRSKCCAVPSKVEYQVTLQVVGTKKAIQCSISKPPYTKTYMHQVILYSHPGVVPFPDFVESLSHNMEKTWKLHIYC